MDRDPRIAERIRSVAHDRVGQELVTREGDLVTEEIEDSDTQRHPYHRSSRSGV
jgi:hypothetical protein